MIAVVILALLMVPVFFVSVQRVLAGDREKVEEAKRAARVARASQNLIQRPPAAHPSVARRSRH